MIRSPLSLLFLASALLSAGCSFEPISEDWDRTTLKATVESVDVQSTRKTLDDLGLNAAARKAITPVYADTALRYGHDQPETLTSYPLGDDLDGVLDSIEMYVLYEGPKMLYSYGSAIDVAAKAKKIEDIALTFELALLSLVQPDSANPDDWMARAALGDLAYRIGNVECLAHAASDGPFNSAQKDGCLAESIRGALHSKSDIARLILGRIVMIHAHQVGECDSLNRIFDRVTPYLDQAAVDSDVARAGNQVKQDLALLCQDPSEKPRAALQADLNHGDIADRAPVDHLRMLTDETIGRQLAALASLADDTTALLNAAGGPPLVVGHHYPPASLRREANSLDWYEGHYHAQHRAYLNAISKHNQALLPLLNQIQAQQADLAAINLAAPPKL